MLAACQELAKEQARTSAALERRLGRLQQERSALSDQARAAERLNADLHSKVTSLQARSGVAPPRPRQHPSR